MSEETYPGAGRLIAEETALDASVWTLKNRLASVRTLSARLSSPADTPERVFNRNQALRDYQHWNPLTSDERAALEALERDGGHPGERERVRLVCAALRRVAGVV